VYYHAPLYRRIAARREIDFTVIFASTVGAARPYDAGYTNSVRWDVDALGGYRSLFLKRADRNQPNHGPLALRDLDVIGHIVKGRYDVLWLHGYNYLTHQLAMLAQLACRKPLLVREEQTLIHPRPWMKRALKQVGLKWLLSHSYALYIGTQNRRWFDHYGVPADRQFFVPYCVDNERLRFDAQRLPSKRVIRQQFGVPDTAGPLIVTVGRLIPKKQPLFLLEAFRRVRSERQCALLFVGSGQLERDLRNRAREASIPDVYFSGFLNQSDVSKAYRCAEVFVLPSKLNETWGLVVNEAMNFGLPVVVTDKVGCAVDLVKNAKNGFVVNSEDPQEMANKLALLVDSPGLRQHLGRTSLEMVDAWNYDVAASGVVAAADRALGLPV
jgi:glycosyltransferase involved in cell wall biosynthesis